MLKVYSAWGNSKEKIPSTVVEGEVPPQFGNGSVQEDLNKMFWRISVNTFEEAKAVLHLRNGWEPYKPQGKAEHCPKCNSFFYPDGFARCWNCDFKNE